MRSLARKIALSTLLFAVLAAACRGDARVFHPVPDETAGACEARKNDFSRFVAALPERPLRLDVSTELAVSTLGVPPGSGSLLELADRTLRLDGAVLEPNELADAFAKLRGTIYVAAPPATTIGELRAVLTRLPKTAEPKLLVRTERSAGAFLAVPGASERARELASELIAERDPKERGELAKRAFAELNACPAVADAVRSVEGLRVGDRWAALKASLARAVPACPCASLDTAGLSVVLLAEQRAGTAALGALPLAFVRDERCGATMPLRSLQRLLEQIEDFDAEFAGRFGDDALRFETVVTNERLLVQFCDALPGETLAALQKAKRALWVRLASGTCEAFRFEPLSPGAPMGTLRGASLAYHYWQAAEELSIFGPADAASKPTDSREWPCRTNYELTGVEPEFVALASGRFFFSEPACRAASPESAVGGCLAGSSATQAP